MLDIYLEEYWHEVEQAESLGLPRPDFERYIVKWAEEVADPKSCLKYHQNPPDSGNLENFRWTKVELDTIKKMAKRIGNVMCSFSEQELTTEQTHKLSHAIREAFTERLGEDEEDDDEEEEKQPELQEQEQEPPPQQHQQQSHRRRQRRAHPYINNDRANLPMKILRTYEAFQTSFVASTVENEAKIKQAIQDMYKFIRANSSGRARQPEDANRLRAVNPTPEENELEEYDSDDSYDSRDSFVDSCDFEDSDLGFDFEDEDAESDAIYDSDDAYEYNETDESEENGYYQGYGPPPRRMYGPAAGGRPDRTRNVTMRQERRREPLTQCMRAFRAGGLLQETKITNQQNMPTNCNVLKTGITNRARKRKWNE